MEFLHHNNRHFRDLINMGHDNGTYMRVRAFVYNGRREGVWDISVDRVEVGIGRTCREFLGPHSVHNGQCR